MRELAVDPQPARHVWIVEDDPDAAALASELCEACGAVASVYPNPASFLSALRSGPLPDAVVFDWRLGQDLSAALFLATRHRRPDLPVVYWTGMEADGLPGVIREDGNARIVDKVRGSAGFEEAICWALEPDRQLA